MAKKCSFRHFLDSGISMGSSRERRLGAGGSGLARLRLVEQRTCPKMDSAKTLPTCFTPSTADATIHSGNSLNLYAHSDVKKYHSHVLTKNGSILDKPLQSFYTLGSILVI